MANSIRTHCIGRVPDGKADGPEWARWSQDRDPCGFDQEENNVPMFRAWTVNSQHKGAKGWRRNWTRSLVNHYYHELAPTYWLEQTWQASCGGHPGLDFSSSPGERQTILGNRCVSSRNGPTRPPNLELPKIPGGTANKKANHMRRTTAASLALQLTMPQIAIENDSSAMGSRQRKSKRLGPRVFWTLCAERKAGSCCPTCKGSGSRTGGTDSAPLACTANGCLTGDKYRAKSHISVTEARTAPLANTGGFKQSKSGINLYRYVLIFFSSQGSVDMIGRLGSWPFTFNLCRQLLANMASPRPGDTAATRRLGGDW
ncbi:hypothetical protein An15g04560 [Aspergillus niger]|uniref:Uncharacterized protein n=2 Tax=Aspergillus niger TaxID=5061 RepID=A2R5J8_ASPNC|nr:hypothetical protein An15g04560 [Aspergillus niger]CAK97323.1 hypothetical protein An15g04560 [Aspergillus niger]